MKKNFVRVIALALAVMMVAFVFAACKKSVAGVYTVKKINDKEVKEYFEEQAKAAGMDLAKLLESMNITEDKLGAICTLTLKDDGTGTLTSIIDGTNEEFKWEQKDNTITITPTEGEAGELTVKDGELIMKVDENNTYTFGK